MGSNFSAHLKMLDEPDFKTAVIEVMDTAELVLIWLKDNKVPVTADALHGFTQMVVDRRDRIVLDRLFNEDEKS